MDNLLCLYCAKIIEYEKDLIFDEEIPTLGKLPYHKDCFTELQNKIERK